MLITTIITFSKLLFVTIFASITYIIQLGRKNSKFLGVKIFILFNETPTPYLLYEQTNYLLFLFTYHTIINQCKDSKETTTNDCNGYISILILCKQSTNHYNANPTKNFHILIFYLIFFLSSNSI